jgi:uncharacterized protein involved in exopolysaccharide biosynthesis
MQPTSFNLIDIIYVIQHKWKSIVALIVVSLLFATTILLIMPKQYQSQAVIVPGNPLLADKSRLFNPNIQGLYGILGNSDDAETIAGIINTDTVLYQITDTCRLVDYYQIKANSLAEQRKATIKKLKKDLITQKTEDRQLKIKILTKNAELSASIVNTTVAVASQKIESIWKQNYLQNIRNLQETVQQLSHQYQQISDSIVQVSTAGKKEILESNKKQILEEISKAEQMQKELKLFVQGMPPALYVVEKASPSVSPDKPVFTETLLAVFFASLLFGILIVLIAERK